MTLEDETGFANVIVPRGLVENQRRVLLEARLLVVIGRIERDGAVVQVVAQRLADLSGLLGALALRSRDFH